MKARTTAFGMMVLAAAGCSAHAQSRTAGGEWTGEYVCNQGVTGARLILSEDGSHGLFHFYALPDNPRVPEGCYRVTGVFNNANGGLAIIPGEWYLRPRNYNGAP